MVQYARIGGTEDEPQYKMVEIPQKANGYTLTDIDDTKGTALADTTDSRYYTGKYKMQYDVYTKKVQKVKMTLNNNGSVALNSVEGLQAAKAAKTGTDGTGIIIDQVDITYSDGTTETVKGWKEILKVFDIYYYDNDVVSNKAYVEIAFKDGKKYPTADPCLSKTLHFEIIIFLK